MCVSVAVRFPIQSKGGELLKNIFNSKEEKISEKVFTHRLLVSVISILICLFALGSSTYAWFSAGTSSGGNLLTSSSFALDILVSDADGNPVFVDGEDGRYTCTFDVVGVYTVVLSMTADSNATKGYCDVIFTSAEKLHTDLVSRDPSFGVDPLTFTVEIVTEGAVIGFVPKWGIPAYSQISDGSAFTENGEPILAR